LTSRPSGDGIEDAAALNSSLTIGQRTTDSAGCVDQLDPGVIVVGVGNGRKCNILYISVVALYLDLSRIEGLVSRKAGLYKSTPAFFCRQPFSAFIDWPLGVRRPFIAFRQARVTAIVEATMGLTPRARA
jgi:hypothetical protein